MDVECIFNVLNAANSPHVSDQVLHFTGEYRPGQGDASIARFNFNGPRMGYSPANARPDASGQHLICGLLIPEGGPQLGQYASGAIACIATHDIPRLLAQPVAVHKLIAHEGSSAVAAVWVKKVHHAGAEASAR
jgi:hypothetical protein